MSASCIHPKIRCKVCFIQLLGNNLWIKTHPLECKLYQIWIFSAKLTNACIKFFPFVWFLGANQNETSNLISPDINLNILLVVNLYRFLVVLIGRINLFEHYWLQNSCIFALVYHTNACCLGMKRLGRDKFIVWKAFLAQCGCEASTWSDPHFQLCAFQLSYCAFQ